jgi:hypothetical protein
MSKKPEPYQLEPWRRELLTRAFEGLPQDYDALSPALSALREAFFTNVAKTLDPAIHKHFQSVHVETFAERKRLAGWVDRVTREHGVTTADPQTGKPGLVIAERPLSPDHRNQSHYGMVITTGRHGKYRSGISGRDIQQDLSDVHLIPAPNDIEERFYGFRPGEPSRFIR